MIALGILFWISLSILYGGFSLLKEIYEGVNEWITDVSRGRSEGISGRGLVFLLTGAPLAIYGAYLYYQVCARTIEDILVPHDPVEVPYLYGISMLLLSLVFTGGIATTVGCTRMDSEGMFAKISMAASVVLLILYLFLKGQMVLP